MADLSINEWLAQLMSSPEALRELVGDSPEAARGARIIAARVMVRLQSRYVIVGPIREGQLDAHQTEPAEPALVRRNARPLDDSDDGGPALCAGPVYSDGGGI